MSPLNRITQILSVTTLVSTGFLLGCNQSQVKQPTEEAPQVTQNQDSAGAINPFSTESKMAALSFIEGKSTQVSSIEDINKVTQKSPTAAGAGARTAFVHLFEWKHTDVANECEQFLGPKGYSAVQISPPNGHRVMYGPPDVVWAAAGTWKHSWAQRYQPVSYNINSRSGTEAQFVDMVNRCHAAGVQIYVDAVINHTTGALAGCRTGSDGTQYCASDNKWNASFPGLDGNDFHDNACTNGIDYSNQWQVQNCWLSGLMDLNTGNPATQQKIANYLNYLTSLGVDGFRFDATKHMAKEDVAGIVGKLTGSPFIFQEVIDMGGDEPIKAADYYGTGSVTDFEFGKEVNNIIRYGDIKDFGGAARHSSSKSVVFTDNHDNQRGHGAGSYTSSGTPGVLTFYSDSAAYKLGNIAMLAWPYGYPKVMSSYDWVRNIQWVDGKMKDVNDWVGPPSNSNGNTNTAQCFTARSGSWDNLGASGGWICEHRWREIANMVGFRNAVNDCWDVTDWQSQNNVLAFGRCGLGFVSINQRTTAHSQTYQTKMVEGDYCNVIDGDLSEDETSCSGTVVHVNADGTASFNVGARTAVAIHQNARIVTPDPIVVTPDEPTGDQGGLSRTVIMIYGVTQTGQDMFIRGGIDHAYANSHGRNCTTNVAGNDCSLPITYLNARKQHTLPNEYLWQVGDTHLDWYGPESGQQGNAQGTALSWTVDAQTAAGWGMTQTVDKDGYGITPLNTYGPHYWLLDVMMDCTKSVNGWFELKSYITNGPGWEPNVQQANTPYASGNHFAQCGKKNVFWRGSSNYIIEDL